MSLEAHTSINMSYATRTEKKKFRRRNEEIRSKYLTAIGTIDSIVKSVSSNEITPSHVDPHDRTLALDEHAQFSQIPPEYKLKKAAKLHQAVEARLKLTVDPSRNSPPRSDSVKIVDLGKPLPLSFAARRRQIQKKHTATVESSLRGLFSANAQVTEGVEQAPLPALFDPPEHNPRAEIEQRKDDIKKNFIQTSSHRSKAEILQHKPLQLHGKKVPIDFVPTCCVLSSLPAQERVQNTERSSEQRRKIPFK